MVSDAEKRAVQDGTVSPVGVERTAGRILHGYQIDDDSHFLTPNPAEARLIGLVTC